jgi:hypothetical protein
VICSVSECGKPVRTGGLCSSHYQLKKKYGRTHKVRSSNAGKICSTEGCERAAKTRGLCALHYNKLPSHKRGHPLYIQWHERKVAGVLCKEWAADFSAFLAGVGEKPEGNFILVRKVAGLYGPDNFKWIEHLKRKPGESNKEWWARKWAARQLANPGMERARTYKRRYGLTTEEYEAMAIGQNYQCAICTEEETSVDHKTQGIRRLAVDHCHKTLKVRALLCWRCNSTIGKLGENIELLSAMIEYLKFHSA